MKAQPMAQIEAIKIQFPEVKFWMFIGRSGGKRIKGQMFPRNTAVPVWDTKVQRLLKRLPYMRLVEESAIAGGEVPQAAPQAPGPVIIPENWRELHHNRRKAMARALSHEDVQTTARADEIIAAHAAPAPEPVAPEPALALEA